VRWYRLTDEERRALKAPAEIEGLGMLALTLFDRWQRDAVFVLVKAFVDESGTGSHSRIMLGALVARAHRWMAFHRHWQRLLDAEGIEFSHIVAMENEEPPFEGWGQKRTRPFVHLARRRIDKNCDFGMTVALSLDDHQKHYRDKLHSGTNKDSAYGTCARAMIAAATAEAIAVFGPDTVVNFVFENNQHFEGARRIFNDMKAHAANIAPHLGQIAPGEKIEYGGLQGADLVASLGRRSEPTAKFTPVMIGASGTHKGKHLRLFHVNLTEELLADFGRHADAISKRIRWQAKKRRQQRKAAPEN
jgi:hypothetical protein